MAGTRFSIDASDLAPLQYRMRTLGGLDTAALMPRLGEYLLATTKDRFATQTSPAGSAWAALAPRTLKNKKKNTDKVLTLRGFLRSSIRYQILDKRTVEVGSHLVYAATHQFGRGGIPARPFIGLGPHDHSEINEIVKDWAHSLGFR